MEHVSVLLEEALDLLKPASGGVYFDGTLGGGGHAGRILDLSAPDGRLAGTDLDERVIANLSEQFAPQQNRTALFNSSFAEIDRLSLILNWGEFDGILLDLGLSSMELDTAERGFSFAKEGPLDMRFSQKNPLTAGGVVNEYSEADLARIIRAYGEEHFAGRIARAIVASRPLTVTTQLAEVVSRAIPRRHWPEQIHPATKTFQAIRMEVNHELETLQDFLPKAVNQLKIGGVIAIISFHSLEDRIVKHFFGAQPDPLYRNLPVAPVTKGPKLEKITRKPIIAGEAEIERNPRARSAKLRAARRIA